MHAYKILYNRSDFNLCLQPLALSILSFWAKMPKVAVSDRSWKNKKQRVATAPVWIAYKYRALIFAVGENGPFFNLLKTQACLRNGLMADVWYTYKGPLIPLLIYYRAPLGKKKERKKCSAFFYSCNTVSGIIATFHASLLIVGHFSRVLTRGSIALTTG